MEIQKIDENPKNGRKPKMHHYSKIDENPETGRKSKKWVKIQKNRS